jgi:hypothetical protein
VKNQKIITTLLAAFLIILTACSSNLEEAPNADISVTEGEGQITQEQVPSDSAYPGPGDENLDTNDELSSETDTDRIVDSDIIGITWQWERYDDTAGMNNLIVDDPTLYTLLLNPDGTYQAKVDCNLAGGSYVLDGSSLKFEPGPTTLAECGSGSLYDVFLEKLGHVATFVTQDGRLYLNLWADAGNMVFIPSE